jgi:hypothetical protein
VWLLGSAARLLAWMDDDPYGFCLGLEKDVAGVLSKAGLAALARQVRARFDARVPPGREALGLGPAYARRRWGEALRTLYFAQKDIAAYTGLTEETGLTARDCHAIATMLAARRKREEALAWAEFRDHPSTYSYRDLMKFVPRQDRPAWHEKAMEAATAQASLYSLIGLLAETKETGRLADLVDRSSDCELEQVSHYALEPAARMLEKTHAGGAARLWRATGMRIVNAGKSRYYQAALQNFEQARRCYAKVGLKADWQQVA